MADLAGAVLQVERGPLIHRTGSSAGNQKPRTERLLHTQEGKPAQAWAGLLLYFTFPVVTQEKGILESCS